MHGQRVSRLRVILSLLAAVFVAGAVGAQEHKIIPGDSLAVTVVGETEYSRTYKVTDDGKIAMPHIGNVSVAGKTAEDATKEITKRLSLILKKPMVLVDVTSYVRFTGEIANTNPLVIQPDARLSHYVQQAGVKEGTADLDKAYLVRRGQSQQIPLDLKAVINATDPSKDIPVEPGDHIYVPRKDAAESVDMKVFIFGEVMNSRPEGYTLKNKMTPLQAITTMAGGFKPSADKTRVIVQHSDSSQLTMDLAAAERGESGPGLYLQEGDIITVPNNEGSRIDVQGVGVTNPGKIPFEAGMRVMEAIQKAGGFTDSANKEDVTVTHKGGETVNVNLFKYVNTGDLTQNVKLEEGDMVFVGTTTATTNEVEVTGLGVKSPGRVPYEPGMRVMNAVVAAGGFTERPKLKQVSVVHKDGTSETVNLEKFLNGGQISENKELRQGDMILVAQEKEKTQSGNRNYLGPIISSVAAAILYRSIW